MAPLRLLTARHCHFPRPPEVVLYQEADVSEAEQEKLHNGLEQLHDVLGENVPHELMVDALVAFRFDTERATDWLLFNPSWNHKQGHPSFQVSLPHCFFPFFSFFSFFFFRSLVRQTASTAAAETAAATRFCCAGRIRASEYTIEPRIW